MAAIISLRCAQLRTWISLHMFSHVACDVKHMLLHALHMPSVRTYRMLYVLAQKKIVLSIV